jgi:hypothetical protein
MDCGGRAERRHRFENASRLCFRKRRPRCALPAHYKGAASRSGVGIYIEETLCYEKLANCGAQISASARRSHLEVIHRFADFKRSTAHRHKAEPKTISSAAVVIQSARPDSFLWNSENTPAKKPTLPKPPSNRANTMRIFNSRRISRRSALSRCVNLKTGIPSLALLRTNIAIIRMLANRM